MANTTMMLARRPHAAGAQAFGHVDLTSAAQTAMAGIVKDLAAQVQGLTPITFHPDDLPGEGEVLRAPLAGFDNFFQVNAAWSLQRAVAEIRRSGMPQTLDKAAIAGGEWTFYLLRSVVGSKDVVIVRARNPSHGLDQSNKVVTAVVGNKLKPVTQHLIAVDHRADAVVVDTEVYVQRPRQLERLLIDAEAVKARAPQTVADFNNKLRASISPTTYDAVRKLCSQNANVARRVERLVRDGGLNKVSGAKLRAALPDAGLPPNSFGASGPIRAESDLLAQALVDLAADLYYQPRFDATPRRVAYYRKVK